MFGWLVELGWVGLGLVNITLSLTNPKSYSQQQNREREDPLFPSPLAHYHLISKLRTQAPQGTRKPVILVLGSRGQKDQQFKFISGRIVNCQPSGATSRRRLLSYTTNKHKVCVEKDKEVA